MREVKSNRSNDGARLLLCLQELRKFDPLLTVNMAATFVVVAMRPGMRMTEISKRLEMFSSTTSRNVQAMSTRHADGSGHDLLMTATDTKDPRAKVVFLTARGDRLWNTLKALMP